VSGIYPSSPPHNLEAEQAVLGCMLLDHDAIARAAEALRPKDFHRGDHRIIFSTMLDLSKRDEPVELITVCNRLANMGKLEDVGDRTYIASLPNVVATAANVEYYIRIVREGAEQREYLALGMKLQTEANTGASVETLEGIRTAWIPRDRAETRTGLVPAADLKAEPVSWLITELLPRGMLALLSGRDKRGKTLLGMEMVRAVLRGEALFDHFPSVSGPVAAFLLDDPESLTRGRLEQLGLLQDSRLHVSTARRADLSDPLALLRDVERDIVRVGAIFALLDALYLFVPASHEAANDQARMGPVMAALDGIPDRTGATVLVIAHDNKSGQDVAGSHVIRARAKVIMRLVLPRDAEEDPDEGPITPHRLLRVESKLVPATSWGLELQGVGKWSFHGTARDSRTATIRREVVDFLAKGGRGSVKQIATALGRRHAEVEEALKQLLGEGAVACTPERSGGRGRPLLVYTWNFLPGLKIQDGMPERNSEPETLAAQGFATSGQFRSQDFSPRENPPEGNSRTPDDGQRTWVEAIGRDRGWPRVEIDPGEVIAPGEAAWRAFSRTCDDGQLARAITVLRSLTGEPGA